MSKDTIYREDAIKATWQEPTYTDPLNVLTEVRDRIESIPSADRPQGEWIDGDVPTRCSICGHDWDEYVEGQEIWYEGSIPNFCPNCGADMRNSLEKPNNCKDEPQTCDTCKYGEDKHRYAHICNECGVGINNYKPKDELFDKDINVRSKNEL